MRPQHVEVPEVPPPLSYGRELCNQIFSRPTLSRSHDISIISKTKPPRPPKQVTWQPVQSAQLHSAAHGVGLTPNTKPILKHTSSPLMEHQPNITVSINHMHIQDPRSNAQNLVDVAQTERVRCQLTLNKNDTITLHLHVHQPRQHVVFTSSQQPQHIPFKGPFCKKVGKVRRKYILPYFTNHDEWQLQPSYHHDIMTAIQNYDQLNGHTSPVKEHWTDAFSDPKGTNAHCPAHWSVLDNAFSHKWHHTNVYAFPPMRDDVIHKTLSYHIAQQHMARQQGKSFWGVYVVPYKPHSTYWSLTSSFQLLKFYRTGTQLFQTQGRKGTTHSVSSSIPMCVLYDQGYTQPDIQMAYMLAMEQCAIALEHSTCDWDHISPLTSSMLDDGGGEWTSHATSVPPEMVPSSPIQHEEDGTIEDITQPSSIFANTTSSSSHLHVRQLNIAASIHAPTYMPNQLSTPTPTQEREEAAIHALQSAGKLSSILEQENPDWEGVDQAIHEHIHLLQEKHKALGSEQETYDPMLFHKTWLEGGYLPINQVRNISATSQDNDALCLVVKTKMAGKFNNTSLIDEGANHSVLNIDWYEAQGIDWKTEFNIPAETTKHTVCMANQVPVDTYGTTKVKMELKGTKRVNFDQEFHLLRLGASNYAQILGFDWKLECHTATLLPEYIIKLRKYDCDINAHPVPIRLYQIQVPKDNADIPPCEEVSPSQIQKDIRLLSARLRRLHIHIPQTAFLRQIIVRPAKDEEQAGTIKSITPEQWTKDDDLEKRAEILRQRIESTYRKEYVDVLDCEPHGVNNSMPHQHVIEVPPEIEPYSQKLRRLSPLEMELLSKYIKEMVDGGRIRPSSSPWGANILFVPKPCGGWRCCTDYRELNNRMKHDTYPLPRIDVHMDMAQGTFWSKMDLLKGFYQLPMHEDSIKYTAFNTLLGKYEFLVMPMGLQNAPGSFMRAMNKIFDGLMWDPNIRQESGILVYLDDILIFSQTEEQHMEILKLVLDRLRQYKLQCRFDKCVFAVTEVEYLGFRLSHQGVRMDPKKVEIVRNWPEMPKNKSDIRAFLGLVNYLKRFCYQLSHHSAILSNFAAENYKGDWTEEHIAAMRRIKELLCSEDVMASPKIDPTTKNYYPFVVITDASEIATGAILLQQQGPCVEDTKVISYASSKFKQAERNYSVHEKELLGVLLAIQQWNCFLEGSKFTVHTDHQSLIWLNKLQNPSRRQARWMDILQGHDFEVLYIKGANNPADAFTRVPWEHSVVDEEEEPIREPLIVLRTLRTALAQYPIHIKVTKDKLNEWKDATATFLKDSHKIPTLYKSIMEGYETDPNFSNEDWVNLHKLHCKNGIFYKDNRVAVPNIPGLKIDVLVEHHDSLMGGHLGITKTSEKICRLFWWEGMVVDIENHVKTCPACQVSKHRNWKPQGHTPDLTKPTSPWEVVHADFAGPFKSISPGGYNRIVIFTDAFTKLAVFVKCKTTMTSETLAELYIQHVWRVYGRVGKLVSDNEPILCADAWLKVHEKLGTKVKHISAYNAKANGAAEVMVKQLKAMLGSFERQGLKWWKALPACEKAYNDSVHTVTGYTPFYMNFGRHPLPDLQSIMTPAEDQLIADFIHQTQAELARVHSNVAQKLLDKSIRDTAKRNLKRSLALEYHVGDYVYLETSAMRKTPMLAPLRSGPYKVTKILAGGNSIGLEGFRHPFHVELLTPVYCYADGSTPHLTKHQLDMGNDEPIVENPVINHDLTHEDDDTHLILDVDIEQEPENEHNALEPDTSLQVQVEAAVQDFMQDSEDVWDFNPHVRIVPSTTPNNNPTHIVRRAPENEEALGIITSASVEERHDSQPADIITIAPHVILPDQLPSPITRIIQQSGRSLNSAMLTCQCQDGSQCRITFRQLASILGPLEARKLLKTLPNSSDA